MSSAKVTLQVLLPPPRLRSPAGPPASPPAGSCPCVRLSVRPSGCPRGPGKLGCHLAAAAAPAYKYIYIYFPPWICQIIVAESVRAAKFFTLHKPKLPLTASVITTSVGLCTVSIGPWLVCNYFQICTISAKLLTWAPATLPNKKELPTCPFFQGGFFFICIWWMHILAQKILSSIILNIPSAITHVKPSAMQMKFFVCYFMVVKVWPAPRDLPLLISRPTLCSWPSPIHNGLIEIFSVHS